MEKLLELTPISIVLERPLKPARTLIQNGVSTLMSPKQKAALSRGQKIRDLVMVWVTATRLNREGSIDVNTTKLIQLIMDRALIKVRGESETAKRKREQIEIVLSRYK